MPMHDLISLTKIKGASTIYDNVQDLEKQKYKSFINLYSPFMSFNQAVHNYMLEQFINKSCHGYNGNTGIFHPDFTCACNGDNTEGMPHI